MRQLLVFQIKLAVDGLKDLVLMPLSLVAGLHGIFSDKGADSLNKVLRLGQAFDDYVDLYGALDDDETLATEATLEAHLSEVEKVAKKIADPKK